MQRRRELINLCIDFIQALRFKKWESYAIRKLVDTNQPINALVNLFANWTMGNGCNYSKGRLPPTSTVGINDQNPISSWFPKCGIRR